MAFGFTDRLSNAPNYSLIGKKGKTAFRSLLSLGVSELYIAHQISNTL